MPDDIKKIQDQLDLLTSEMLELRKEMKDIILCLKGEMRLGSCERGLLAEHFERGKEFESVKIRLSNCESSVKDLETDRVRFKAWIAGVVAITAVGMWIAERIWK